MGNKVSVFIKFSQIPTSESEHLTHCSSPLAAVSTPDRDNFLQKAEKLGDKKEKVREGVVQGCFWITSAEVSFPRKHKHKHTVFHQQAQTLGLKKQLFLCMNYYLSIHLNLPSGLELLEKVKGDDAVTVMRINSAGCQAKAVLNSTEPIMVLLTKQH